MKELNNLKSRDIATFIMQEHPQAIALICTLIEDNKKLLDIIQRLPEGLQAEVLLRMSNLESVSDEMLSLVKDIVSVELAKFSSAKKLNGFEKVKELIEMAPKDSLVNVLHRVEEKDPELHKEITPVFDIFEDVIYCSNKNIKEVLPKCKELLPLMLSDASPAIKGKVFSNMEDKEIEKVKKEMSVGNFEQAKVRQARARFCLLMKYQIASHGKKPATDQEILDLFEKACDEKSKK